MVLFRPDFGVKVIAFEHRVEYETKAKKMEGKKVEVKERCDYWV